MSSLWLYALLLQSRSFYLMAHRRAASAPACNLREQVEANSAAEVAMRVVGVIFAALVTLGLAALGVVAAQKTDGPGSPVTRAAHVMLSSRSQEPISEPIAARFAGCVCGGYKSARTEGSSDL